MIDFLQTYGREVAAGALATFVVGRQAWPKLSGVVSRVTGFGPFRETAPDSDQAPPKGFVEHAKAVLKACPDAPPEVRLSYVMDGKTVAETLWAELARNGKEATDEAT